MDRYTGESPEMERLREWQGDAVQVMVALRRHLTGQEELSVAAADEVRIRADRLCDWVVIKGDAPWKEEQE